MARRKMEEQNVRKLTRTGRGKSVALTIPIKYVRALRWKEHQKVVISKKGATLVIKDWKK